MKRKAVYAGTFDPITNGHIDIIKRALKLFDEVIVAVSNGKHKKPLFTQVERVEMIKNSLKNLENVKVEAFSGLLVDYLKEKEINIVIRGLRVISDFEYEFQLALLNKKLSQNIEIIYLMPEEKYLYISSSAVKEIASYGGDVSNFVSPFVAKKLMAKYQDDWYLKT